MFNQQKNYKKAGLGALALFLTAGLLTLTFAFTNHGKKANVEKVKKAQTWVFIGTQLSQATDTTYYQLNPGSLPEDCGEGTQLPCQVMISDDDVNTKSKLHDYINNQFDNDPQEVLANATTQRPTP